MREAAMIPQKHGEKSIFFLLFLSLGVMLYAVAEPEHTAEMIRNALVLFAKSILPSLFAFSVSAKVLMKCEIAKFLQKPFFCRVFRIFGVSASGFLALFIGFLSGFPTGAAVLADAVSAGEMEKREAERLLPFCNNAGAAFVIGAVGVGAFGSPEIGRMLFLAQLAASLLALMLTGKGYISKTGKYVKKELPKLSTVFTSSVSESVMAMLAVGGYVVCFSVLSGMFLQVFDRFLPSANGFCAFFAGLLELSGGLFMLSEADFSPFMKLFVSGALLGFGGICVLLQVMDRAAWAGISTSFYLKGKLLTMLFSAGFAPLFCFFGECRFGGLYVFSVFLLILCIGTIKNLIFFKKTMEKPKRMLYNKNKIQCP